MSIYSYDHAILARSREVIRRSLELLRWSDLCSAALEQSHR